jgi:hypothetical protein
MIENEGCSVWKEEEHKQPGEEGMVRKVYTTGEWTVHATARSTRSSGEATLL